MEVLEDTQLDVFRKETRAFLEANCPASMRQPVQSEKDICWGGTQFKFVSDDQKNWFECMKEKGWTVPAWPKEYGGGGLNKQENIILKQEMAVLGCRAPLYSFGIHMLGPALLKFGNEEQKAHYLPQIAKGEIWWCQGYSEPNAGSDLANLQTKAEDKGDHYLVNGQKVWTSYADSADWIFCLVRTSQEHKHKGISFMLIDMNAPGVSVRPIKLISGKSPFCETFFDDVKVPKENLIGIENEGWTIAKFLLTHERSMIGGVGDSRKEKHVHAIAKEAVGLVDGKLADAHLREKVTKLEMDGMIFKMTLNRFMEQAKAGQAIGASSSFFKYYGTELNKDKFELLMELNGTASLEWEGEASNDGRLARQFLRTKANSIEGGTSEVQLNIIAKHILGLPKK